MDKQKLRSGDLLLSSFLTILGIAIAINSLQLMAKNPDRRFYVSNGLVPLLIGIFLTVLSIGVIVIALKEGGTLKIFSPKRVFSTVKSIQGLNTIFILAWIAIYIWGLLKFLPYLIATFVFLLVMFRVYYRKNFIKEIIIALITSSLVTFLFGNVVNIPLP